MDAFRRIRLGRQPTLSQRWLLRPGRRAQFDWATATLRDNTAGSATTVLPKTSSNAGRYVRAVTTVTARHSYTLTLTSHDDNHRGDPTYTLYDDATVQ